MRKVTGFLIVFLLTTLTIITTASGQDLANTTVCDPCHSPGGAYDGVNDPYVGAKSNWVSGVYGGSALQHSKEKWCVGCHYDGDSSLDEGSEIDGVIAPNITGDDASYGYYKTGHGKHGFEQAGASREPATRHTTAR